MKSTTREKLPILHMEGMKDWERWLTGHHESSPGVWLMIAKKGTDASVAKMGAYLLICVGVSQDCRIQQKKRRIQEVREIVCRNRC